MQIIQAVRERFSRGERRRCGGHRVRTRVALPAVLDFPQDVLRALRLLEPGLDGYILPDGRVWILQLVPNRARIEEGRRQMATLRLEDLGMPDRQTLLMAEGFWLVAELPYLEGTSAGAAVTAAQRALYATDAQVEATYRANRAEADHTNARRRMVDTLRDRIRSSARSDWARTWRGRRTFSN